MIELVIQGFFVITIYIRDYNLQLRDYMWVNTLTKLGKDSFFSKKLNIGQKMRFEETLTFCSLFTIRCQDISGI